jgi:hypothetical protein
MAGTLPEIFRDGSPGAAGKRGDRGRTGLFPEEEGGYGAILIHQVVADPSAFRLRKVLLACIEFLASFPTWEQFVASFGYEVIEEAAHRLAKDRPGSPRPPLRPRGATVRQNGE